MKLWIKNMVETLKKREIHENIRFVFSVLGLFLVTFYFTFFVFFGNNLVGNESFVIKHTLSFGIAICGIIDFIMDIILKNYVFFIIFDLISILWAFMLFLG